MFKKYLLKKDPSPVRQECSHPRVFETLRRIADGRVQIEERCRDCRKFTRWTPYKESHIVRELLEESVNAGRVSSL